MLGELREWKGALRGRILAVAGCMAQRVAREILQRAGHVDIVMGTRAFHRVEELVGRVQRGERPVVALEMEAHAAPAAAPRSSVLRAFVPIIRGCTNFCSYCIVPYVRGPEVSRTAEEIAAEVEGLVAGGTREVTLLGQNVLAYGRDLRDRSEFPDLLSRLNEVEGLWRIRFTTCHPRDVDCRLIAAMAGLAKVCEHIHLPIQAGTNRLLFEMNRGYTTDRYLQIVSELRARVPGIAITTDIMVGFPGETEEEFEESLRLYQQIGFDAAFTFAYSVRPGTKAAAREDQVPRAVRLARLGRLIEMQNRITIEKNEAAVGEEAEVLVDGPAHRGEGLVAGRARNNKQVILPGEAELRGSLVTVRLVEAHLWGFSGEMTRLLAPS
jgi:tRNA-2-methylthio-N6-dimethylallyladenosine synthase